MEKRLGEFIRDRLDELGLSQKELAERVGMSTAQVSRVINGERGVPRLENLFAIADALSVKRDEVLKIAAGERYEESEPYIDPWVAEMNYKISLLRRDHLRRIAEAMLQRLVDEEQAAEDLSETKPLRRSPTQP